MQAMDWMWVGLGGFFGAIARYGVYSLERTLTPSGFPFGTLVINISGCFIAGLLLGLLDKNEVYQRQLVLLLSVGFVGSFTTFSTFSVDTILLYRSQNPFFAAANVAANVFIGVLAVWGGQVLAWKK